MKQSRGLGDGFYIIDDHQLDVENVAVIHREGGVRRLHHPRRLEVGRRFHQLPEGLVRPASTEQRACVVRRALSCVDPFKARREVSSAFCVLVWLVWRMHFWDAARRAGKRADGRAGGRIPGVIFQALGET